MFSIETPAERKSHLGLNITDMYQDEEVLIERSLVERALPTSMDWARAMRPVENQGKCGSCWAFSAVSAIEGNNYIATGDKNKLSEQEMLTCSYTSRDGCRGGWMSEGFKFVKNAGRLATQASAPYTGKGQLSCNYRASTNGMTKGRVTSYKTTDKTDNGLMSASSQGVISVAMLVVESFYMYKSGVYSDNQCMNKAPNHAVTVTGYGDGYWLVRNSWGIGWGEKGYVKMSRSVQNVCGIARNAMMPIVTCRPGLSCSTPSFDESSEEPSENPSEESDCEYKDSNNLCSLWARLGYCAKGKDTMTMCPRSCGKCDNPSCKDTTKKCYKWLTKCGKGDSWMEEKCGLSCATCQKKKGEEEKEESSDGCPASLKKCSDGVCRHEHMCDAHFG